MPYTDKSWNVSVTDSPTVSGSPSTTNCFNRCILSFNLNHKPVNDNLTSASVSKLVPTFTLQVP